MARFIATMTYELHPSTEDEARKLLRAELAGRRWLDRHEDAKMPANTVWAKRIAGDEETTDDVYAACARELRAAVAAVERAGRKITLLRAWVQVSGAGTWGLVPPAEPMDGSRG